MKNANETALKYSAEKQIPTIKPGWTIKVFQKIKEGDKERIAPFEGIVTTIKHGQEAGGTFTVRKMSGGVGVEKTFPVHSPTISKIEILKTSITRRAKLYYIREKSAKEIRRKLRSVVSPKRNPEKTSE